MRRIDLRTPDGWRSFDAMNGVILTLIPLILAGLYFTGFAPPMPSCSDAAATAAPRRQISCTKITAGAEIEFPTGSADLTDDGKAVLDSVRPCLTDGSWEVGGHTDAVGSADANKALSLKRAQAAADYLRVSSGQAVALKARGYGAAEPVASNDTDEGRALNRRISFRRY